MSKLMLDVGQALEIREMARRERGSDGSEWSNESLKALCERKGLFGQVLDVLQGRSCIVSMSETEFANIARPRMARLFGRLLTFVIPEIGRRSAGSIFVGNDFDRHGSDCCDWAKKSSRATDMRYVVSHELSRKATFREIAQILLDLDEASLEDAAKALILARYTVTLPQIEHLLKSENVKEYVLGKSQEPLIFFVEDEGNGLRVIVALLRDRKLRIHTCLFESEIHWDVGSKVFSTI